MTTKSYLKMLLAVMGLLIAVGTVHTLHAQDDETKAIKAEEFIKQRPAKGPTKSASPARYRRPANAGIRDRAPSGLVFAELGVTLWRFRPSTVEDKTKELIEEAGEKQEVTLERIEEGTLVSPGQRIRVGVESLSRDGFLYVIDREQYSDGTFGEPLLIFPTERTSDSNHVSAGRLIYIPSSKGKFNIKPSANAKTQVAEVITLIVSPQPLIPADQFGPKAIRLPRQIFDEWEKKWGTSAAKFEMVGGKGLTMTEKEQAAGTDGAQVLTLDDPPPQTIYRVALKSDVPLLVTVPLRFEAPKR